MTAASTAAVGGMSAPMAPHDDMRNLLLAVERLHRTLQQSIEDLLEPHQLSVTQWLIVSGVAHASGQTLTDFSRLLDRDAGSLSRAIHQLNRRGLLIHRRNPHDRRSTRLVLTAEGRAMHEEVEPRVHRLILALGSDRLDAGHAQLSPLLAEFAAQVETCRHEKAVS